MKTLCVSLETAKALKAAGWSKPKVGEIWEVDDYLNDSKLVLITGINAIDISGVILDHAGTDDRRLWIVYAKFWCFIRRIQEAE